MDSGTEVQRAKSQPNAYRVFVRGKSIQNKIEAKERKTFYQQRCFHQTRLSQTVPSPTTKTLSTLRVQSTNENETIDARPNFLLTTIR